MRSNYHFLKKKRENESTPRIKEVIISSLFWLNESNTLNSSNGQKLELLQPYSQKHKKLTTKVYIGIDQKLIKSKSDQRT